MNMQYFWIQDQETFKNFPIAWKAGQEILVDNFT